MFGQFSASHECAITSLESYKLHGPNAEQLLVLVHYTELAADKGIVLMRGRYSPNTLSPLDAQMLANLVGILYTTSAYEHVRRFNAQPDSFDFHGLIETVNALSASTINNTNAPSTPSA